MYKVRVEADFAAAHALTHYHGKCENLHGHNYRVRAWAQGQNLQEGGMLLDFSILKKALRKVCGELDHRNLNDFDIFKDDPSAERIAKYIFSRMEKELAAAGQKVELLFAIDVYETPTSMARYERD